MALGATCVRSPGWKKASPGPMARPLFGGCSARQSRPRWALVQRLSPGPPAASAHKAASAAADFAAKEAFLKAAGTGLAAPFSLCEIEAVRLPSGAPNYRFSGKTAEWVAAHHLTAKLSLSHDGGMALAFCTLEQLPPET